MAKLVHYSGEVQGVGFRATATGAARRHPGVRGWVRNLPDGRVELYADGPDDAVGAYLDEVRARMAEFITAEAAYDRDPDPALVGFRIVS